MIRVLVFIALLALLAAGGAWLADRPGDVAIVWQGYRIETSVAAGLAFVAALSVALVLLWSLLSFLLRIPDMMTLASRSRRRNKGYAAISRGMIAVGSGDSAGAKRHAADAERLLGREPLALLLKAQTAQIAGDRAAAEAAFNTMLEGPETRVLGLRGLYVEARRKGDAVAARAYAAKAVQLAPSVGWANEAVLEYQSADRDWRGALATLDRRLSMRLVDKETARRQRAVLLAADALARAEREPDAALAAAREAAKAAPDLAPAAVLAGRLLSRQGALRKAAKILEASWKVNQHPEVARAYIDLRPGDSALDRLGRAEALFRLAPRAAESRLAVAQAALDAREFRRAREAMQPLVSERPTLRACLLMAEIEDKEKGATGAVREWLFRASHAPRDPAWIADGVVSEEWAPVSPVTGRLDAFVWAQPPEVIGSAKVVSGEDKEAPSGLIDERIDERARAEALVRTGAVPAALPELRAPAPAPVIAEPVASAPAPAPQPSLKAGNGIDAAALPGGTTEGPGSKPAGGAAVEAASAPAGGAVQVPLAEGPVLAKAEKAGDLASGDPATAAPGQDPAKDQAKDQARELAKEPLKGDGPASPAAEAARAGTVRPAVPVIFPTPHAPDDPGPGAEAEEAQPSRLLHRI